MTRKTLLRLVASLLALTLVAAACGDDDDAASDTGSDSSEEPSDGDEAMLASDTGAATLRAGLTGLLTEHVYLAALATGSALRGDDAGFEAYATALNGPEDSNSADLTAAITSAYGDEVGQAFDGLWRSEGHIPSFVAYTQAVAAGDQAAADQAVEALLGYAETFGTTLNGVNENLPADVVTEGVTMHVTTLKAVVDAQAAGDQTAVYASVREAYGHMAGLAEALAVGTAQLLPDQFDGDAASPAAGLRAGLTALLREHVLLASSATGAALGGRTDQFDAVAAALNGPSDSNTADIVAAVRSVYGDEVGDAFDGLWRSEDHIPAFVAYTQAVAADDEAAADQALESLVAYADTFGTTMSSVNPNLSAEAVTEAITGHATTLKAVIDAQRAGDTAQAASLLRAAVAHMSGTADVLASATVAQFPDQF